MQKKKLPIMLTVLFIAFALMLMSTSTVSANLVPTVDTDKPLYPYWKVGGTVVISGKGYDDTHIYNVTVIYPGAVKKTLAKVFTGITAFTADYVISVVDPEGTYKVEVYDVDVNALVSSCHFGIWGTDEASYQRTETVTVVGGGANASSKVTVNFYNTTDDLIATKTPIADVGGEWLTSWAIPRDADLGTWTVEIGGFEFDSPYNAFLSETTFEVNAAILSVTIDKQPDSSYERTETASMTFWVQYPDNSYYTDSDLGSITVGVYRMAPVQTPVDEFGLVAGDFDSGTNTWNASWNIPKCAELDDDYHFKILENGIEDKVSPDPNKGPSSDVASDYFEVVSAELSVVVTSDQDEYGGLSTVYFTAEINYPNGTDFTTDCGGAAYANIWMDADDDNEVDGDEFKVVEDLPLTYDSGNVWKGEYLLYDPPGAPGAINGTYKIKVYAADSCDNSGEGEDFFDVVPETKKDPTEGPVGTEVDIWGSGFAPDTGVSIVWNMSITRDFVGMGDGVTNEFGLVLAGFGYVKPGTETIRLNGVLTTDYTIDYATGVVTFDTAPGYGVVITADYELLIPLAWTMTNEYGSFTATFTVPESYAGEHVVIAVDGMNNVATDIFDVEPQIVLSSTKGPPEAWITVTGTGFAPNEEVDVWVEYWYEDWYYIEEWSWVIAVTDAYGTFSQAILLPTISLQSMYWDWGIAYGVYSICAEDHSIDDNYAEDYYLAVLFCEPSVIDVEVKTGALYFPGEIFTVYALTSVDGVPIDVHDITFLVYYETLGPIPMSQMLPVVHVDTGLYAVTTTLPPDMGPGNYLIVVTATKSCWIGFDVEWNGWDSLEWEATINGVSMDGFIISPTLMDMNAMLIGIEGDIATINTNIGLIQLSLSSIDATLSSIQGSIATIETNIGTIQTDISKINGAISSIQGNIVTITSDLGTITTDIADINGHLASIDGSIVTITTDIGTIKTTLSSINARLTTIEGDVATIMTDVGAIELKLDETVIPLLQAIKATLVDLEKKIDGYYLALNTTIGEIVLKVDPGVFVFLEAIEAKLEAIGPSVVRMENTLGDIELKLDDIGDFLVDINATLTSIEGRLATIETDIGTIQVDIASIDTSITSIEGNMVTITTKLGTIEGRLTTIEGDIATIQTDIGEIKVDLPPLQETSSAIQSTTTLGMSIGSVLSAVAAIAAVAACILIFRRLKVAS